MPAALVLLLAIAQAGAPSRDVRPETGTATISGRITERGSSRPLPRILVTLLKPNSSAPFETVTDEDGRYQFTDLEPGAYALSAGLDQHRSTYLSQRYGSDEPGISDPDRARPNLQLKPGERRAAVDFALWRALAIEGRVVDPWETGMANVPVIVKRVTDRIRPSARAYSDDRGTYRVYGLIPGRYRVCVEIDNQSDLSTETTRLGPTCYPAADETNADEVVLTSDDATGVDIRVQQFRSHALSLSGTVVDAGGSPVSVAFVGAYPVDGDGPSAWGGARGGEFVLRGLAPRRYLVRASAGETPDDERRGNRHAQVGYASADLSAGDAGGVVVPLFEAVEVAGKVTFEGLRAGIRQSGMVVRTSPGQQRLDSFVARPPFSPVEDNLSFKLTRVYRLPLVVHMTGLPEGWVLKSVLVDRRDVTYVPTDLAALRDSAQLEIVLTNRVAQPLVRVLDEQGRPVSSFQVVAVSTDRSRGARPFSIVTATRAQDDLMKVGPMVPGEYFVAALSPDDASLLFRDRSRIDALASVATRVRLEEGDNRTLDLRVVSLPPR
jgi:hypothetical protein